MRQRVNLQASFIIHRRYYRETSVILELFTHEQGRVAVIARGVRTERSRQRGLLQLFTPLLLSWTGKGELPTLTHVENQGSSLLLPGNALAMAFYMNELLQRLLARYDPYPELFQIYRQTLQQFSAATALEASLRIFEKRLLEHIGYALPLGLGVGLQAVDPEQHYYFDLQSGIHAMTHKNLSTSYLVIAGKSLLALAQEKLDDLQCLYDAKRILRQAIAPLLGGKPLYSRQLYTRVGVESDA